MPTLQTSLIWAAYAAAVGVALLVATLTTYAWQAPRDRSALVTAVAIASTTALLATVFLLPVDIALVSATASPSLGAKKDWATPAHVAGVVSTLEAVYYTLYAADALLVLVGIPFAYFWYEECDDVDDAEARRATWHARLWAAVRYTAVCVVLVAALFVVGFFVPAAGGHHGHGDDNDNDKNRHLDLDYFRRLLAETGAEKALTFAVGLLVALGSLVYAVYVGAGMALLPVALIKSAPSVSAPQLGQTTASALEQNRERQRQLEMRHSGHTGRSGSAMPAKDRRELEALMREERTLVRRARLAAEAQGDGAGRLARVRHVLGVAVRPLTLLGGLVLLLLAVVVALSMLVTGIDKAANSVCKQRCGYILGHINVFQPFNWLLVRTAPLFPVDYLLIVGLVLFFFASALSGLATVGVRFLWVRVFALRKGRTAPQALLVAAVLLALIIFAINYAVAIMVAPQYASFGTQTFCMNPPARPGAQPDCTGHPDWIKPCSEAFGEPAAKDVCTPTVVSTFLNRVALNWPVFGAVAFWAQFAFLAVFLVVLATALVRTPRLDLAEMDADAEADEEEGLLASTGRRFGATWQDLTGRTYGTSG